MLSSITLSCDGERSLVAKLVMSHCQEKLLALYHNQLLNQFHTSRCQLYLAIQYNKNVPGLKQFTEAVDTFIGMVGERSMCDEGIP